MAINRTLTGDIRKGDLDNTLIRLHGDGVDADDFAAIGKNVALRADIVAAIIKHRLFTPPEEQILRLIEINEKVWHHKVITPAAIRELGDPPECPPSDENGLYCVCLLFEVGNVVKTLELNWQACVYVHGEAGTWKWDGLLFKPEGVKQRVGALPRKPGLRWQVAELGRRFKSQCVQDVRPQLKTMGMGQELPLIVALHPKWAVSMNGDSIPCVDAPDLSVAPRARGGFSDAPCVSFYSGYRQGELSARRVGSSHPYYGSGFLLQ